MMIDYSSIVSSLILRSISIDLAHLEARIYVHPSPDQFRQAMFHLSSARLRSRNRDVHARRGTPGRKLQNTFPLRIRHANCVLSCLRIGHTVVRRILRWLANGETAGLTNFLIAERERAPRRLVFRHILRTKVKLYALSPRVPRLRSCLPAVSTLKHEEFTSSVSVSREFRLYEGCTLTINS